jgi:formiminoglutamase
MRTLVFGGGHETAWAHGRGVLDAFPNERVAIINLDAHLDLRKAERATSGTPFRQLAHYCAEQSGVSVCLLWREPGGEHAGAVG